MYLIGISERVADIKTRAQAMKCLTTFSEAVGPGFIFERVWFYGLYNRHFYYGKIHFHFCTFICMFIIVCA